MSVFCVSGLEESNFDFDFQGGLLLLRKIRSLYLSNPWQAYLHNLQRGALLINRGNCCSDSNKSKFMAICIRCIGYLPKWAQGGLVEGGYMLM